MLTGWIDASGAAAAAMAALENGVPAPRRSCTFDDDTYIDYRARRPMLELRDGVNTRLVWSRHRAARSAATRRATTCCCSPVPSRTWRGTASPTTVADLAERARRHADGRPRRLPVRHAAHPPAAPVGDVAVADVLAGAAVPHSSVDVPAGHGRRARARARTTGASRRSGSGRRCRTTSRRCRTRRRRSRLLDGLRDGDRHHRRRRRAAPARRCSSASASTSSSPATTSTGRWSPSSSELYDAAERAEPSHGRRADGELELRSGDELAAEVERFLRDQGKS